MYVKGFSGSRHLPSVNSWYWLIGEPELLMTKAPALPPGTDHRHRSHGGTEEKEMRRRVHEGFAETLG
jgi:hypothetical protein